MTTDVYKISKSKKVIFTLIAALGFWLICDTTLYIFLKTLSKYKLISHEIQVPPDNEIDGFYKKYFHPRWGWNIRKEEQGTLGNRFGHTCKPANRYKMKTFGDSYTFGSGVNNNQTFQYQIEEMSGWDCINFGVSGYGPDQALLKYKDITVPTYYTLLCIFDENIGRIMTVWWGFYSKNNHIGGTKPRFDTNNGSFYLVENPAKNYNDLRKLRNIEYISTLEKYDYWHDYYQHKNVPSRLRWPVTPVIISYLDFFVSNIIVLVKGYFTPTFEGETAKSKHYHLYSENSDGIKIMSYIVDEFTQIASERSEIPVVIIFPLRNSVDIFRKFGKKPYQTLVTHLERKKISFIDFGEVFAKENYPFYYLDGNEHFTPAGNKRVAEEIINHIHKMESTAK